MTLAIIIGIVCGVIGAVYGAIAMAAGIYAWGMASILGFVLDVSWSLLNSLAALVWMIVCAATSGGGWLDPTPDSTRSGTFVFTDNPRGGGYGKTTVGTVIAGGWCSHEETHVWQARFFGPTYLITYILALLLNLFFRLITGKLDTISKDAYYRICFEDWAYAAGSLTDGAIDAGMWMLWFVLSALYVGFLLTIAIGFALKVWVVGLVGIGGLVVYSLIRALTPRPAGEPATG